MRNLNNIRTSETATRLAECREWLTRSLNQNPVLRIVDGKRVILGGHNLTSHRDETAPLGWVFTKGRSRYTLSRVYQQGADKVTRSQQVYVLFNRSTQRPLMLTRAQFTRLEIDFDAAAETVQDITGAQSASFAVAAYERAQQPDIVSIAAASVVIGDTIVTNSGAVVVSGIRRDEGQDPATVFTVRDYWGDAEVYAYDGSGDISMVSRAEAEAPTEFTTPVTAAVTPVTDDYIGTNEARGTDYRHPVTMARHDYAGYPDWAVADFTGFDEGFVPTIADDPECIDSYREWQRIHAAA